MGTVAPIEATGKTVRRWAAARFGMDPRAVVLTVALIENYNRHNTTLPYTGPAQTLGTRGRWAA